MVIRLEGKVDGNPIIFERKSGDVWETTIPQNLNGIYVVELTATDEAGNQGFVCKYILTVDLSNLYIRLDMCHYNAEFDKRDYKVQAKVSDYYAKLELSQYYVSYLDASAIIGGVV